MESVHTIAIGERRAFLSGAPGDPYWQAQKDFDSRHFPLARFISRCVPEDAVTLDVGANIGLITLLLAMQCAAGHVFAVEPVAENLHYLRRNLALNGIRNCTIIEAAAGRMAGEVAIHSQGSHSNVVGSSRESEADARVSLLALDGLAQSALAGRRLSFAKVDVEGFEPDVLDGARRLIARDRPWIFMEFNSWCLWSLHAYDQCAFARALWDAFEVSAIGESGQPVPAFGGDPDAFLRHNATHGFVDDLLLRLRDSENVPSFEEMTSPESARRLRRELEAVRRDLEAMRNSTSWKVPAPLRALGAVLGPRAWPRCRLARRQGSDSPPPT